MASTTTTRKKQHTAKQLLSPEVPLDPIRVLEELVRGYQRGKKNPLAGREQVLAEMAPSITRAQKLLDAEDERKASAARSVRLREVEEDEEEAPEGSDLHIEGVDPSDDDLPGDEGEMEAAS